MEFPEATRFESTIVVFLPDDLDFVFVKNCERCGIEFPGEYSHSKLCRICDPETNVNDDEYTVDELERQIALLQQGCQFYLHYNDHRVFSILMKLDFNDSNNKIYMILDDEPYYEGGPNVIFITVDLQAVARKSFEILQRGSLYALN